MPVVVNDGQSDSAVFNLTVSVLLNDPGSSDPPGQLLQLTYDSGADDYGYDVVAGSQGNIYVAGRSDDNDGDYNIVTYKYDSSGTLLWRKPYIHSGSSHAKGIAVDATGNVYVAGYAGNGQGKNCLIIKYDTAGNVVWMQSYDNDDEHHDDKFEHDNDDKSKHHDEESKQKSKRRDEKSKQKSKRQDESAAYGVAVDDSGNVIVVGRSGDSALVLKYVEAVDGAGDKYARLVWVDEYRDNRNSRAYDVAVDGNGNIFVTGRVDDDVLTVKYDSDGVVQWADTYNGVGDDTGYGIALDMLGNAYVTGRTKSSGTSSGYLTIKYDEFGNESWVKNYGGGSSDKGQDVAVDHQGSVYVTGYVFNGPYSDVHTIKYDTDGNVAWVKVYDGGKSDKGRGIALGPQGEVYVAGNTDNGNNHDLLLLKYGRLRNDLEPLSVSGTLDGNQLTIDVSLSHPGGVSFDVSFQLLGSEGAIDLGTLTLTPETGGILPLNSQYDLSGIASDYYTLQVRLDPTDVVVELDEFNNVLVGNTVTYAP